MWINHLAYLKVLNYYTNIVLEFMQSTESSFFPTGIREPFLISSPYHAHSHGKESLNLVSLLDITPTVLDWLEIPYPEYSIFHNRGQVKLSGKSVLPLLSEEGNEQNQ